MKAPALELADIFRIHGPAYLEAFGDSLSAGQKKAVRDISVCRTAALGGYIKECDRCGHRKIAYRSCRNRHCSKCQAAARAAWLERRAAELLPVEYFHVVFTLPDRLASLALHNQRVVYAILFRAASETLLRIAADPKQLGAQIGFLAVLHTWGQNLHHHPHLHCVVPGGGIALDHSRWISCRQHFLLPVKVLSRLFRAKFASYLKRAFQQGKLRFARQVEAQEKAKLLHLAGREYSQRVGSLRQTTLWRTATGPEIPGALYPSRGHLQPAPRFAASRPSHLSVEGLFARKPARHHDPGCDRVHPSLSCPCLAQRLREDPSLWLPR